MAVFGKIYSFPNDYRVQRIQAIAAMNGLTLEIVPNIGYFDINLHPLCKTFPLLEFPAFETPDGSLRLVGAEPIARFVAESGPMAGQLLGEAGGDAAGRALIAQWTFFATQVLGGPLDTVVAFDRNFKLYDFKAYDGYQMDINRAYAIVNLILEDGQKFLVGEQLTLADIMVASALHVVQHVAPQTIGNPTVWDKKATDYTKRIMALPEMEAAFPADDNDHHCNQY